MYIICTAGMHVRVFCCLLACVGGVGCHTPTARGGEELGKLANKGGMFSLTFIFAMVLGKAARLTGNLLHGSGGRATGG